MSDLTILRPEWLLLLPILLLFGLFQFRKNKTSSSWKTEIDPKFLEFLSTNENITQQSFRWLKWLPLILIILGLSGPAFVSTKQALKSTENPLMVVLDQSFSMGAVDVAPDRHTQAKRKIIDILDNRLADSVGLIVYAGSAHLVSPITKDFSTLYNHLENISPFIMPAPGSNVSAALELATQALEQQGNKGQILLITDGVEPSDSDKVAKKLTNKYSLSVLAIGTSAGGAIQLPNGGYLKANRNEIVIPALPVDTLQNFAADLDANIMQATIDDTDISNLIQNNPNEVGESSSQGYAAKDFGYWFIVLALPFLLLHFRRTQSTAISALFLAMAILPDKGFADAFKTPDQQGFDEFQQGNYESAAEHFKNEQWKASSLYENGQYEQAAEIWNQFDDAESLYNLGNSLTQMGKYDEAIEAYNNSLEKEYTQEAEHNRGIAQQIKEMQQQETDTSTGSDTDTNTESDTSTDTGTSTETGTDSGIGTDSSTETSSDTSTDTSTSTEAYIEDEKTDDEVEKWLEKIDDNPGVLLQRKFEIEHQLNNSNQVNEGPLW